MSLHRTPPKFPSEGDLPGSMVVENEDNIYINTRKRKQPHNQEEELMKALESRFNNQLSLWNSKITDSIKASISEVISKTISQEMSKLTSELANMNTKITQLTLDCTELHRSVSEMDKTLHFSIDRQDDLERRLNKLEGSISHTSGALSQIQLLENKITSMEQQARQCNIEVSNIPDRRGENLISVLEALGNVIKQPIHASDIMAVHRVPHADQKDRRPKNIIVKFHNRMLRDNVIAACRATKGLDTTKLSITGPPTNVYVNEHLTLGNKMLFRQCREAARKNGYKYVWIKHGVILARKTDTSPAIAIRAPSDIAKIN